MTLRSAYRRGFVDGYLQGRREVADAAAYTATHARAATTAGQLWLGDLADHARQLAHPTGRPVPPPETDLLRTPPGQLRAVTSGLSPQQARQATYRYGFADGRIAAIGVTARDLYLAAGQDLGSLRPAIDGRPAHLWLEAARMRWLDLAAAAAPPPGTRAALARSTLTGGATPARGAVWPGPPAALHTGQVTAPAPARGVAPVVPRPAVRR